MLNIPTYTQYRGETKIALMDNSTIAFMEQMEHCGDSAKELLRGYDVIFIPNWVLEEVEDSEYRCRYIESLKADGFPFYAIAEESYADLAEGEEGNLYKIVLAAVSSLAILKSYMRRFVEKQDSLDMAAYSEWISEMYQKWPISNTVTETGRVKKKNAGEISLTILAEVISWYYPGTEMITVYTQDRDSYIQYPTVLSHGVSVVLYKELRRSSFRQLTVAGENMHTFDDTVRCEVQIIPGNLIFIVLRYLTPP